MILRTTVEWTQDKKISPEDLEKLKAMLATYNSSDRNIIVNVDAFNHLRTSKEVKVVVHRVLQVWRLRECGSWEL